MSFDGTVMRAVVNELNETIVTGRITKIYQPYKTELVFTIRANGKTHQLLLSANPSFARMHITSEKFDNPKEPPMFCMLLRKHLEGSIIESITQLEMERIVTFTLKGRNELGDISYKQLKVEIMGRHSNIILIDHEEEKIIDSIKHLPPSLNSYRTILPGYVYKLPPHNEKLNPLTVDHETFLKKLDFNQGKLDKQLIQVFSGLSPQIATEILHRAKFANQQTLLQAFQDVFSNLKPGRFLPQIIKTEKKEYFSIVTLSHIKGTTTTYDTVSEMLTSYYFGKAERDRVHQQANDLERFLKNEYQKNKTKIEKLRKTLVHANDALQFRKYGELLTAYLHQLKKGDKKATIIDFYDEDAAEITIPLDPQKTPAENAQNYFKRYTKAKNSLEIVEQQIKLAEEEMQYLDQLIQQMEVASPKDIAEIREELVEGGYLKQRKKQQTKKKKELTPQLEHYQSTTGTDILVGKNNKQNEYLTNRLAKRDDTWLHTKDIPGSHVVIRSNTPDETTLKEAATIAAFFSKARQSSSVPVDYTLIKHVKKPSGAKPGYVIYDEQTTIYVTPDEALVQKLQK